jgi:hypothetical protein
MNQSENSNISNFVLVLDEAFYLQIGSTWTFDSIYLFVFTPLGLSAFILNLVSFFILNRIIINQTKLYKYLKVYSLNSCLISLILAFLFLCYSSRYFEFLREPLGKWYECRIVAYGLISLYFVYNLLDILIVFIRLSIFIPKLKFLEETKPYFLSFFLCLFSFSINLPIIFMFDMLSEIERARSNHGGYCAVNQFSYSSLGIVLSALMIIIRDIITLILELITSILAIYHFIKFESNKRARIEILNAPNQNIIVQHDLAQINTQNENRSRTRQDRAEAKFLWMTISIAVPSFVIHLLVCAGFLLNALSEPSQNIFLFYSTYMFTFFCLLLKQFFNIFIFYFFNSNFKTQFKAAFRVFYE